MKSTQCYCCEKPLSQSDYGGMYCITSDCPLEGSIDPCIMAEMSRKIYEYQSNPSKGMHTVAEKQLKSPAKELFSFLDTLFPIK